MPRKVLLMGRSGVGKTSMKAVIFQNQVAAETRRLGATINAEAKEVTFLADMKLDLWDCGGQESFMDNYLTSQKEHIFRGVQSLIYIFDVESPQFTTTDLHYFCDCLAALRVNAGPDGHGPAAVGGSCAPLAAGAPAVSKAETASTVGCNAVQVHVLIHKMDLVPIESRDEVFASRTALIQRKCAEAGFDAVQTFGTSIWDETLYKAWSHIVSTFIPNVAALRQHLRRFADLCRATEVILFEGRTFLLISQSTATGKDDLHIWEAGRFEKITQVIKVFRLNCRRLMRSEFAAMTVSTASYTAVLDSLTPNTFMMVISTDPGVQTAGLALSISQSRAAFKQIQGASWGQTL